MNCLYHQDLPAAVRCAECGAPLCIACAEIFPKPLCKSCGNMQKAEAGRRHICLTVSIFTLVFLLFGLLFSLSGEEYSGLPIALSAGYIFASIPAGWQRCGFIQRNKYSVIPILGGVLYLVTRLTVSVVIGFFTMPISIIMAHNDIRSSGCQSFFLK